MADTYNCLVTMYGLDAKLESKLKRTVRIFEKLDTSKDYKLERSELEKNMMEDDIVGRINREDTDKDGSISLVEYVVAFMCEKLDEHYKAVFDSNVEAFIQAAAIKPDVAERMNAALGATSELEKVMEFVKKDLTEETEKLFVEYKKK